MVLLNDNVPCKNLPCHKMFEISSVNTTASI